MKYLLFICIFLLSTICYADGITVDGVPIGEQTEEREAPDCGSVCSYWPYAYPVKEEDSYEWGSVDNVYYSRMSFTKDGQECWCECQEGYKWRSVEDKYEPIMVGNCAPMAGVRERPEPRGGWVQGCGDGVMECTRYGCPSNMVNILDGSCEDDMRARRDCCCKEGYQLVTDEGVNYCTRERDSGVIRGRLFLEDPYLDYPTGGVRNVKVTVDINGNEIETYTDIAGLFEVKGAIKEGMTVEAKFILEDKDDHFRIIDGQEDPIPVWISKEEVVTDVHEPIDIEIFLKKNDTPEDITSSSDLSVVPGLVKEFMIYQDAWSFTNEVLQTDVGSVDVITNYEDVMQKCDSTACYSPTEKTIYLGTSYVLFDFKETPGTEFHEFGHHTMYSQFSPVYPSGTRNHGGFLNPDTSDSLQEGEADFLALMTFETYLADHPTMNYRKKGIMSENNYEFNYKPWDFESSVQHEERAVSTLLYDLFDERKDPIDDDYSIKSSMVDDLSIPLSEIWDILKDSSTNTVWDLYNALIITYDKRKVDGLFLGHGFFIDLDPGDGNYSAPQSYTYITDSGKFLKSWGNGDVYYDKNKNFVKDPSEDWQDIGHAHDFPGYPVYTKGVDTIGTAADASRPNRKTQLKVPGSYIKVPPGEYNVHLFFDQEEFNYEYITWPQNGLLYVTFPPARYGGEMVITPSSRKFRSTEELKITSEEYHENLGGEYFAEHDFEMIPSESERSSLPATVILVLAIIVALLVFSGFRYRSKKNRSNK